jgi:hypothetical protein
MTQRFLAPTGEGFLRKPTDRGQINGPIVNPPRYAEFGGLSGPDKTTTGVNRSIEDIGNPFSISKPNGGRA